MNERMERITRQAIGRWRSHRDGADLAQEARLAYWQSEGDGDALLVVKVRRRVIDAWRRMTRSREQLVAVLPDVPVVDVTRYDASHLGLPPRWQAWVEQVANGEIDADDPTADAVRIYLRETGRDGEVGS